MEPPVVSTPSPSVDHELAALVSKLADMGFTESKALEALTVCSGDVNAAASYLISTAVQAAPFAHAAAMSNASVLPLPSASPSDPILIQGPISQYSIENGRSACTCIALTAAHKYLAKPSLDKLTPVFLHEMVVSGVSTYLLLLQASMVPGIAGGADTIPIGDDAVEHFSAEQVMTTNTGTIQDPTRLFSCMRQIGPVRQGVLNKDVLDAIGLPSMLHDCWTDGQCDEDVWTAVVVTKTPETLLVLLPPLSMPEEDQRFILIDSHPRPNLVSWATKPPTQAYARIHTSLEDLVLALTAILPITHLEDSMINVLYNSFDLYVIQHDQT
ncbi:hypothetical protein MPSEU_000626500 [Mayamaea pseudoterrestris]|nr:hypothetical protein MPSEU_000626500 [Mayamaea pseudoterrestris]